MNTPTTGISKVLYKLLRPLFHKHVRSTTIIDGVDLICHLEHSYHKVKGVPIDAIRKLARIVLTENVFIYEKKFYRQVIGGAMGSAFTLT
jgi:hypothetical protein